MSRMSELVYDLCEEIEKGELSFREIAEKYEVPYSWVDEVAQELAEQDSE